MNQFVSQKYSIENFEYLPINSNSLVSNTQGLPKLQLPMVN